MAYTKPKVIIDETTGEVVTDPHHSSEWYTPTWIVEHARSLLGAITLDPASCAKANEFVQAKGFYGKELDGLALPWHGSVWLNPPYGTGHHAYNWTRKCIEEYKAGRVEQAVMIVQAYTAQKWFGELWSMGPICFLKERVRFIRPDGVEGTQPMGGHAIVWLPPSNEWGLEEAERMAEVFKDVGTVVLKVGS